MKVYILSPTPFFLLQNPTFCMLTKVLVPEYMYIQILWNLTWWQEGMSAMLAWLSKVGPLVMTTWCYYWS
jgi:hypothetical protein